MKQYVLQVDKEKNLVHTNGCNPTPQQQFFSITKRTTGKLQRIPLYVLEDMKVMFDEGQPISFIRRRIRNRIPLHIKTDARWFMNLRVTIEREKLTKQARTSESSLNEDTADIPPRHKDATVIPTVMRSILGPVLRQQGLPVLNILSRPQQDVPGFMYAYVVDKDNQLAGWCYMTPRQRASLEDNGHVLFFDTNAKGTNKYGMPFFAPAVMNQDNMMWCCMDTCERERVLHLQRNEESALTFLNWRKRPSDHYSVSEARSHISDYGCHLFLRPPIAVGPHSTND